MSIDYLFVSARKASTRPAESEAVFNFSVLTDVLISLSLIWAGVKFGSFDRINPTTPATCGVAIEVPDHES